MNTLTIFKQIIDALSGLADVPDGKYKRLSEQIFQSILSVAWYTFDVFSPDSTSGDLSAHYDIVLSEDVIHINRNSDPVDVARLHRTLIRKQVARETHSDPEMMTYFSSELKPFAAIVQSLTENKTRRVLRSAKIFEMQKWLMIWLWIGAMMPAMIWLSIGSRLTIYCYPIIALVLTLSGVTDAVKGHPFSRTRQLDFGDPRNARDNMVRQALESFKISD